MKETYFFFKLRTLVKNKIKCPVKIFWASPEVRSGIGKFKKIYNN